MEITDFCRANDYADEHHLGRLAENAITVLRAEPHVTVTVQLVAVDNDKLSAIRLGVESVRVLGNLRDGSALKVLSRQPRAIAARRADEREPWRRGVRGARATVALDERRPSTRSTRFC